MKPSDRCVRAVQVRLASSTGERNVSLKVTVFSDVAPYSLVKIYRPFRSAWSIASNIALMTKTLSTSETSVNFYQTTRHNFPEDSHLHFRRRENQKTHDT
jgi:hypothetical protein